jgi:transposase
MPRKKPQPDAKEQALREHGSLNPRPHLVTDPLFGDEEFCDARDLVQVKYEMLRRVRVDGRSVTESAAAFGFSRPSFYQAQSAFEEGGLGGLLPQKPGPRRAHKLRHEVVDFIADALTSEPTLSSLELAARVESTFGLRVHARSVERALARREALKKKRR